ncbi:peptide ABC transporter permease [Schaalia sp. ZJ405]|uniref:peptide ABC transporter permease n=1 Tax=Schaalia sp. ZJ405 TaxID=2709403 RepID=UPI0013EAC402|nr:peptide ABC transporter permease [Schaalia sp. ZJ405]QPK81768.1 peptide ABC transporter permease [Schaalia sp. ZJ405]
MKTFRFFVTRIFLRKPVLAVVVLVLILATDYIAFMVTRTLASTSEGLEEVQHFNLPGIYIANLDPDSPFNPGQMSEKSLQDVYDRIQEKHTFGLFTDGYIADVKNRQGVDVPVAYMNQTYSEINGFTVAEGTGISFDYDLDKSNTIPVLVGKGLADDYPLNTKFSVVDPGLNREVTYVVTGILTQNSSHSHLYVLDSKQYYNFSIIVPVTEQFIQQAHGAFKINGLMDLMLLDTSRPGASELGAYIEEKINLKFNFSSQQDNIDFYHEYFYSSMVFLMGVSLILVIVIIFLAVWGSLAAVRVMLPDFTINLLVGLSYEKFQRLLVAYYALLSLFALSALFAMVSYSRHDSWSTKVAFHITYGPAGGLIQMDWIALLAAFLANVLLVAIVVQSIVWRIKRVPISIGVLQ